ncbi:hypothetical protein F53441_2874 [Fusarium austroafricanum]|uniref:Uncharacterized protein n=1 Tax=Fusarium austroafricanum TaxID=2364996 RepID=A0A8H4KR05_9HYPO|nr:hypothetical protein F53441_2874 [Fusarium austroafricanum]
MEFAEHTALARIEYEDTSIQDFMSYVLRHNDEKGITTYLLLKNPDKLKKLKNKIYSAFNLEEEITITQANQLKYMLAAFNEGFRIYPPVAIGLLRLAPANGEFIDGYWIPENFICLIGQHTTQN